MGLRKLLFSAQGRASISEYWLGVMLVALMSMAAGLVLLLLSAPLGLSGAAAIAILQLLVSLLLIYPQVCVQVKRIHDIGYTGWLVFIPWAAWVILLFALWGVGMRGQMFGMGLESMVQGFGATGIMFLNAIGIFVIFTLWLGFAPGTPGPNAFGERSGIIQMGPVTPSAHLPAAAAGGSDPDIRFWDQMTDKNDPDALQEYLFRYPSGRFAELARSRMAAKGVSPVAPPPTAVQCAQCGAKVGADDQFCDSCGAAVVR